MGMESTMKNSALLTVFVVSIVIFGVMFAADNGSDITISGDSRLSGLNNSLLSQVDNLQNKSETSREIALKTTLESGDEHQGSGGQFKIGPYEAMGLTVTSINAAFGIIFGSEFNFIMVLFATIFTFLIGYYIIKAWLGRDPN